MRKPVLVLLLVLCLGFRSSRLRSQTQPAKPDTPQAASPSTLATPQTPEEFFARARQLSDLEAAGIPFHLKATYVASGDTEFTGNGTYEEWWKSESTWRKEATLGNFRYVAIAMGGPPAIYSNSAYVPLRLRQAVEAVLIHIDVPDKSSNASDDSSGVWQAHSRNMRGIKITVLSRGYQCKPPIRWSQCRHFDYYFTQGGVLRIMQTESITTVYNAIQPFRGLLVPRDISVANGQQRILAISVGLLEPIAPGQKDPLDSPPSFQGLQPIKYKTYVQSNAEAARILSAPAPVYPLAARNAGIKGTVVMNASVDDQGIVREPYVSRSSGSPLLDESALQAVRRWRYTPLTLDGKPVTVETTISVVFNLSR